LLRQGEHACREVLRDVAEDSPLARTRFAAYFERLYYGCQLDKAGICDLLTADGRELAVSFRTAAEKFRLIDDENSLPVVVRYRGKDGRDEHIDQWLGMLHRDGPQRWLMRKLQRYTVNLHRRQALHLLSQGEIEEVLPGLYAQTGDGLYDENLGLRPEGKAWKAEDFVR
jgi:CRISPR-associated endonuclease/helicase Cas3